MDLHTKTAQCYSSLGIQLGLQIMENTTSFQKMSVEYTEPPPENCRSFPFRSHDYWQCYVKQRGYSWLHIVGTCSMGPNTDPMAVVDSRLKYNIIRFCCSNKK